jgi:hypothetical protein
MAAVGGHISYQLLDGNNVPWAHQLNFNCSTGLLADITAFANAYAALLDLVTQSYISRIQFVIEEALPGGLKTSPTAGSNGNVGALLNYKDNNSVPGFFSYWISDWIVAGFEAAHPALVDQAETDVANYLAFMLGTANNTKVVTEDDLPLTELKRATKSVRTRRKALGLLR